jgi:hypothetical protein
MMFKSKFSRFFLGFSFLFLFGYEKVVADTPKPFSRVETIQFLTNNCVRQYQDQEVAKVKPYCDCVSQETYGKMSDAEIRRTLEETSKWKKSWKTEGVKPPSDPALRERLKQTFERHTHAETACTQKTGLTVPHVYEALLKRF